MNAPLEQFHDELDRAISNPHDSGPLFQALPGDPVIRELAALVHFLKTAPQLQVDTNELCQSAGAAHAGAFQGAPAPCSPLVRKRLPSI